MMFNVVSRQLTKMYTRVRQVYYFLWYCVLQNMCYRVFTARFFLAGDLFIVRPCVECKLHVSRIEYRHARTFIIFWKGMFRDPCAPVYEKGNYAKYKLHMHKQRVSANHCTRWSKYYIVRYRIVFVTWTRVFEGTLVVLWFTKQRWLWLHHIIPADRSLHFIIPFDRFGLDGKLSRATCRDR